jgi:hypothetical protein
MSEVYKLLNTTNDYWKSQFVKKSPIFTKKKYFFQLLEFQLRSGPRAWPFLPLWVSPHPPPSPSWQKSHLLAPYRYMKFKREKKCTFFIEEIVFFAGQHEKKSIWQKTTFSSIA